MIQQVEYRKHFQQIFKSIRFPFFGPSYLKSYFFVFSVKTLNTAGCSKQGSHHLIIEEKK